MPIDPKIWGRQRGESVLQGKKTVRTLSKSVMEGPKNHQGGKKRGRRPFPRAAKEGGNG